MNEQSNEPKTESNQPEQPPVFRVGLRIFTRAEMLRTHPNQGDHNWLLTAQPCESRRLESGDEVVHCQAAEPVVEPAPPKPEPDALKAILAAAEAVEWPLIGGVPCLYVTTAGQFCRHSEHWIGHAKNTEPSQIDHPFVSLAALLGSVAELACSSHREEGALQKEKDSLYESHENLFQEVRRLRHQALAHRWNITRDGEDLLICERPHDKDEPCRHVRYCTAKERDQIRAEVTACQREKEEALANMRKAHQQSIVTLQAERDCVHQQLASAWDERNSFMAERDKLRAELAEVTQQRDSLAAGVLTAARYPRGSEAQIRCLEEIGADAAAAPKREPIAVTKEAYDKLAVELTVADNHEGAVSLRGELNDSRRRLDAITADRVTLVCVQFLNQRAEIVRLRAAGPMGVIEPNPAPPAASYRLLETGEIIQAGDEWEITEGRWVEADSGVTGWKVMDRCYRRPITGGAGLQEAATVSQAQPAQCIAAGCTRPSGHTGEHAPVANPLFFNPVPEPPSAHSPLTGILARVDIMDECAVMLTDLPPAEARLVIAALATVFSV